MNFKKLVLIVSMLLMTGCELSESVIIDAPVEKVWSFLADNRNSALWSTYFTDIRTMSSTESGGDATVGTIRRCYRGADESLPYWDELTLEVEPLRYRRILSYNFHGYKNPHLSRAQFVVHNIFESLGPDRTRLTFSNAKWSPDSWSSTLALFSVASSIKETLHMNLENIKAAVEAKEQNKAYERVHSFIEPGNHPLDKL